MSNKMTQVGWDDDEFLDGFPGIGEYHAKIRQLRADLVRCRAELATVDAALDVERSAHRGSVLITDDVVNEMRQEVKQLQTDLINTRVLAALVTPKLAALLERLAQYANLYDAPESAYNARELAARIREALALEVNK